MVCFFYLCKITIGFSNVRTNNDHYICTKIKDYGLAHTSDINNLC